MTQCNHCRELRKVKQVHVRCACKPDDSDAPKRVAKGTFITTAWNLADSELDAGKGRRTDSEQSSPNCRCDDTGVCSCATPRAAATQTGRRRSMPATSSNSNVESTTQNRSHCRPSVCTHTDDSGSSCCSSNESPRMSCSDHSSSLCSRSPSDPIPSTSCCSKSPTSQSGTSRGVNCREREGPSLLTTAEPSNQPEPPSLLQFDPLWLDTSLQQHPRSHRYAPYPQPVQPSPQRTVAEDNLFDPSFFSNSSSNYNPIISDQRLDNGDIWQQFLRSGSQPQPPAPIPAHTAPPSQPTSKDSSSSPHLESPSGCGCILCATHAQDPKILSRCSKSRICDTCYDCSALKAALTVAEAEPLSSVDASPLEASLFPGISQPHSASDFSFLDRLPGFNSVPSNTGLSDPLRSLLAGIQVPASISEDAARPTTQNPIPPIAPDPKNSSSANSQQQETCDCGSNCSRTLCSGNDGKGSSSFDSCKGCKECSSVDQALGEVERRLFPPSSAEATTLGQHFEQQPVAVQTRTNNSITAADIADLGII